MNSKRFKRLEDLMKNNALNQVVVTSTQDIYYFTGKEIYPGERMLALYMDTDGRRVMIINELNATFGEIPGIQMVLYNDAEDPISKLKSIVKPEGVLGIDKNWPSHFLIELMDCCKNLKFVNSSLLVDRLRMIKDEEEKELMRNASRVVDKVMQDFIKFLSSNVTERQAADELKEIFAKYGTYEYSFDPIVAYGANGADPHHDISDDKLKPGDSIIIDIGGRTDGYCSDITRTVFYGTPAEEASKIYNIVLRANTEAIKKIKPGVKFSELDLTARKVIEDEGYGKYFTHRTGHCIGIEDHEFPSVSSNNDMPVEVGMTFSIEPGIYIPGKYGVRIEDLVLVTEDGCEVLNSSPKELKII